MTTEIKRFTSEISKTARMNEAIGFLLRLQVELGKALSTDEVCLATSLAGREVTIKSREQAQPLSKTKWIVLEARGFATESDARDFGEHLRSNVQIAALCSHVGADVGMDTTIGSINEDYFRSLGLLKPHQRYADEIHGISVLPDDNNTLFPLIGAAELNVRADPAQFIGAMSELAGQLSLSESAVIQAVRHLNLALINPQPLARIVLAFSAIEALGQNETWTPTQVNLIKKLASEVNENAGDLDADERSEVATAIGRLHPIGLRQGVLRVLARMDLGHLRVEWDRLYGLRSRLFHGTGRLTKQEVNGLAAEAVKLCTRIILEIIKRDGIKLPSVASMHFGKI